MVYFKPFFQKQFQTLRSDSSCRAMFLSQSPLTRITTILRLGPHCFNLDIESMGLIPLRFGAVLHHLNMFVESEPGTTLERLTKMRLRAFEAEELASVLGVAGAEEVSCRTKESVEGRGRSGSRLD